MPKWSHNYIKAVCLNPVEVQSIKFCMHFHLCKSCVIDGYPLLIKTLNVVTDDNNSGGRGGGVKG